MTEPTPMPEDAPTPLLEAEGLVSYRGDRSLFSDVGLTLSPGEVLQVHGPNGSGKTTLLRILCGLSEPTEGTVRWRGQMVGSQSWDYFGELLYVGHASGVKLELTPVENLRVARALSGNPTETSIEQALERLNLYGFEDVPARTLSAGQRRRVALARLLITKATLWIVDEPFTSLDVAGTKVMEEMIHKQLADGGMAVLTSHQPVRLPKDPAKELYLAG